MSDYIGRPCGSVCGIPEDAHQTEEHPWVAAREPAGAGLREALTWAREREREVRADDWAFGGAYANAFRDEFIPKLEALRAALASPAEPGLDVERLARAMDAVSKAGGRQVAWGNGADSIAAAIAAEYARLSAPQEETT